MKETIYKRIFVIVLDSLGIGAMPDSEKFGDRDVPCCRVWNTPQDTRRSPLLWAAPRLAPAR